MIEIIEPDKVINVMISEDGKRLWVCTEEGTILRAKVAQVMMDDKRNLNRKWIN